MLISSLWGHPFGALTKVQPRTKGGRARVDNIDTRSYHHSLFQAGLINLRHRAIHRISRRILRRFICLPLSLNHIPPPPPLRRPLRTVTSPGGQDLKRMGRSVDHSAEARILGGTSGLVSHPVAASVCCKSAESLEIVLISMCTTSPSAALPGCIALKPCGACGQARDI